MRNNSSNESYEDDSSYEFEMISKKINKSKNNISNDNYNTIDRVLDWKVSKVYKDQPNPKYM